eukprot:TRINITY_DN10997_c0_g1_i4.p1 TRINITY_DN10997_c0_g1~~TRINITY_DN10997_c0_g1_i4.p1  ORF type:complete len:498 (+),score=39.09 TRINITY_DN10997_c0_g1_i4:57-1550(+)
MTRIPFCVGNAVLNTASPYCYGSFPNITSVLSFVDDQYQCKNYQSYDDGLYSFGDQWSPIIILPVALISLVLLLVTLPCNFRLKELIEWSISKLDLYPIQYTALTRESTDVDNPKVQYEDRKRRSVIGGWLTLFGILVFISGVTFLILTHINPRNVTITPYITSSSSHLLYGTHPQQLVQLRFQALILCSSQCDLNSDNCKGYVDLKGSYRQDTYTCNMIRDPKNMTYYYLSWDTEPIQLNDITSNNTTPLPLNITYTTREIGELHAYFISSALTWAVNTQLRSSTEYSHLMQWAEQFISNSKNSHLLSSFQQCYHFRSVAQKYDNLAFQGYFRRIHFTPTSKLAQLFFKREIVAQGVAFTEMESPVVFHDNLRRRISVSIGEEACGWLQQSPSLRKLFSQILGLLGSIFSIPYAVKRLLQVFLSETSGKPNRRVLKLVCVVLPFLLVAAIISLLIIMHPEYYSSELYNTLWTLLIFFVSICVVIIFKMYWVVGKSS